MNRTKIDWPGLDYTWNPVVGCKRGCSYCYAKRMNDRFKWVDDFSKPQLFPKRLNQPYEIRKPSKIFVGSMTDFCYVDRDVTRSILDVCRRCSWHEFMFLTKSPSFYQLLDIPRNVWIGCTMTGLEGYKQQELYDHLVTASIEQERSLKMFVSVEPILGPIAFDFSERALDLIIVGAMTGPNSIEPKKEWIESIKHHNIHYKSNIKRYL
jgi:protein gp37